MRIQTFGTKCPVERFHPTGPNQVWSMDFVADHLADGRRFRALTVIDIYTRECLAIEPEQNGPGRVPRESGLQARPPIYRFSFLLPFPGTTTTKVVRANNLPSGPCTRLRITYSRTVMKNTTATSMNTANRPVPFISENLPCGVGARHKAT